MSPAAHDAAPAAPLWEDALADQVITSRAERGVTGPIVCASGISPSGPIHLGNLREVFTTHLVAEALRRRGEEVVHLHSWDDYDRFRKVPAGVDPGFERYVGMPLARIPDPTRADGGGSYAEHFMDELRASLEVLGIRMTERRQSELYPAGTYNARIRTAMEQRLRVFDVLAGQQTAGRHARSAEERRREYYPFRVFCTECGRDDTRVIAYRDQTVVWECRHGHAGEMALTDGAAISGKLVWKVDWPMRWAHEDVAFEPAGEDHHAPTASFTVGRVLVAELYGGRAPDTTVYSFVSLAGAGGKMSGSVGGAPIPATALDVLEPAILRWLYVRRLPRQSFQIDLSPRAVQRLYDEWDRLVAAVAAGEAPADEVAIHRESTESSAGEVDRTERPVSFRLLASVADLTQGDRAQIARIVAAHLGLGGEEAEPEALLASLQPRLDCAIHYATQLIPEPERTRVRPAFDPATHAALDDEMRAAVAELSERMTDDWSVEGLTTLVYAIPKRMRGLAEEGAEPRPSAEIKQIQRAFFKAVYRLTTGAETGPRLPTLLLSIGPERARELLVGARG
ncbi:MAG TPA: lysine--tRNA ligase [Solirubrobacteraceae bacterium]|nr:lysine--tRNA ligase [Solirubrobacteraceae bacterium]